MILVNIVVDRRPATSARGPDVWARRHGLELTAASRPWVASYLRTGRNLRQVGGFGGLVVAASVTAATGLDLDVSGLVWILLGYLVGCLWAELALTRVPAGTRRAASLVTRRLGDYLPRRMQIAEVVVPVTALVLGAVVVLAHLETRLHALSSRRGRRRPESTFVSPYRPIRSCAGRADRHGDGARWSWAWSGWRSGTSSVVPSRSSTPAWSPPTTPCARPRRTCSAPPAWRPAAC